MVQCLKKDSTNAVIRFKLHKKQVKGGRKISTEIAKDFMEKGILCVPGWQLCRNCYHKQFHFLKENGNDLDNEMDFSEI